MDMRKRERVWVPKSMELLTKFSQPFRDVVDSTRLFLRKTPIGGVSERLTSHGSAPLSIRTGQRSICGNVREKNEDDCYTSRTGKVLVVADGMGGHRGGSRASRIVTEACQHDLTPLSGAEQIDKCVLKARIHRCMKHARNQMIEWVSEHPRDGQMGTTVAIAMVIGNRLYVAHVGDSRVYHYRNGRLRQLTIDETLAQALVEAGAMTEENAAHSRYRHMLINCVGVREFDHLPDVRSFAIEPGDRLLLATDGFTEFVSESDICEVLDTIHCPQDACNQLVSKAVQNDSTDNITVVLADVVIDHTTDILPVEAKADLPWLVTPSTSLAAVACSSDAAIAESI